MIQNDTKTSDPAMCETVHIARTALSRPVVARALGLLLGLGLVAGCGDDGGDSIFSDDAGADAAIEAGNGTTDETSSEGTTTESTDEATTTSVSPVTSSDPSSNETATSATTDATSVDTSAVTDTSSSSEVTSTTDVSSTDVSSTTDVSSSTDSTGETSTDSTEDAGTDVTIDLDGGVDATDVTATDSTELDSSVTSDDSSPDAADTDIASTVELDAGDGDVDTTETTEPSDASDTTVSTDELDASDGGGPVMLTGVGPIIPDPAVDLALSGAPFADGAPGDGIDDAIFTATITAPISKLVLVNTDADGDPYLTNGSYYTFWTSANPVPTAVPSIPSSTDYNIHTLINGTDEPLLLPVLGSEDEVTLDMYVSFPENPLRTDYYRLYVFGVDDELTQIVDFAPTSDAGSDSGN